MLKIEKTGDLAVKRLAMLIIGPAGVGKTSLIKTLPQPTSETLMISFEGGTLCLRGTDFDVIESDNNDPIGFLENVYSELDSDVYREKYKSIFIDSLTEIGQSVLSQLKKDPHYGQAKNALQMYGKYNDLMTTIIKSFRDMTSYNVFFTALDSVEKDGLEKFESVNVPGSSLKSSIRAWFDIVVFYKIFKDENGVLHRKLITSTGESPLAKDRSGRLEAYEDADLSAIINKVIKC